MGTVSMQGCARHMVALQVHSHSQGSRLVKEVPGSGHRMVQSTEDRASHVPLPSVHLLAFLTLISSFSP